MVLTACATHDFPTGGPTFHALPSELNEQSAAATEYKIGPLDLLDVTVFEVKDLTQKKLQVDASGHILLPLIGSVQAAGKTTTQLSSDIADKLREKYLQDPQVSVMVEDSALQKVTVTGAVTEAGVYKLKGRTTLIQAVAMAKGPDHDANLHRVAIFREVDGRRMVAVYDLDLIRAGRHADPEIEGNDVVVVDNSAGKGAWHSVLALVPLLWVFQYL